MRARAAHMAERWCPDSGMPVWECVATDICDCFPDDEDDPKGLHPERFTVIGAVTREPEEGQA